jgi:acetolactate synthase-1/2/3 large subunit
LGVALVTTGPGGTNAITGITGSWIESVPVMIISGQVKRPDLKPNPQMRMLGFQEIDIVTIVKSITKYAVTIIDPKSIRYHLEKAVYLAKTGRHGPVWIDLSMCRQQKLMKANLMDLHPKLFLHLPI